MKRTAISFCLVLIFLLVTACPVFALSMDDEEEGDEDQDEDSSTEPEQPTSAEAELAESAEAEGMVNLLPGQGEDAAEPPEGMTYDSSGQLCPIGPTDEIIEDELEDSENAYVPPDPNDIPFDDVSDSEIQKLLAENPDALGPMSVGYPNSGALFNGIPMPKDPRWNIVNPAETYGTQETIDFITAAVQKVHEKYPDGTPALYIGDISDRDGGRLNRHVSHQAGRDVDLSWYYKGDQCSWWAVGTADNLDLARTWALVRALVTETDAELLLIDSRIQRLLYDYAKSQGEDPAWLHRIFQHPNGDPRAIIRHARGHATHIHARFYNRMAQEMGRRAYPYLVKRKLIKPPSYYVYHKVRRGETLGHMARKYGTSVSAIKRANGLRSNTIRAGRSYRIPKKGGVKPAPQPLRLPARLMPTSDPWYAKNGKTPKKRVVAISSDNVVRVNPIIDKEKKAVSVKQPQMDTLAVKLPDIPEPGQGVGTDGTPEPLPMGGAESMTPPTPPEPDEPRDAVALKPPPKPKPKKAAAVYKRHVVKKGESLWTIAKKYGTSVNGIKAANGISSNALKPGQKLKIPSGKGGKSASSKGWVTYKVKSGDSLWKIAAKYKVKVTDLKKWNGLKSNSLKPGQKLKIYTKF